MTVTADAKRRVVLPDHVKKGDRFDLSTSGNCLTLVPLVPAPARISENELRRRIKAIKWQSHLSATEARRLVTEGRA